MRLKQYLAEYNLDSVSVMSRFDNNFLQQSWKKGDSFTLIKKGKIYQLVDLNKKVIELFKNNNLKKIYKKLKQKGYKEN